MRLRSGQKLAALPSASIPADFTRAELVLIGLKPPTESFEVRFFADDPEANAQTPTSGNPRFLASQFFYGLGIAQGASASQSARTDLRINITDGLRAFQTLALPECSVNVIAISREGDVIAAPDLDIQRVSFQFS